MTERSWPWNTNPPTGSVGDGATGLNETISRQFLAHLWTQDLATEGIFKGLTGTLAGELAVSGTASPLTVAPGAAICYGLYLSDANVNLTVTTPSLGTTGGRVVLQTNWAGVGGTGLEARTRLVVKLNSDGVAAIPSLTQTIGVTWEISLATFTITTAGVITRTDTRKYRRVTGEVSTNELLDLLVTTAKIADAAVTSIKLAAGAVTAGKIATGGISAASQFASGVVNAAAMGLSAVGNSALATDAVTPDKVQNRTRRFFVQAHRVAQAAEYLYGVEHNDSNNSQVVAHFRVPVDFVSGLTIRPVGMTVSGTGTVRMNFTCYYASNGQGYSAHSASTSWDQTFPSASFIREYTNAASLSSAVADDYVNLQMEREPGHTNDTLSGSCFTQGFLVEYTADS